MFNYEQQLASLYITILFSVMDVSLTYYTVFLEKKRVNKYGRDEVNFIYRSLMQKTGLAPWSLLIALIIPQFIIFSFIYFFNTFELVYMLMGALLVANIIHIHNINIMLKNWNNVIFWNKINGTTYCRNCGDEIYEK